MGFDLIWQIVIALSVELMRVLEFKVAVELALNDYGDSRCVLSANQLSQMQATFQAVVCLYIEESWRAVAPIVAQLIGLFDPSILSKCK